MNTNCFYCPPRHFLAHDRCHTESDRFLRNRELILADKENIPNKTWTTISEEKIRIDDLYRTSIWDFDYYIFYLQLEKYNNFLEAVLDTIGI